MSQKDFFTFSSVGVEKSVVSLQRELNLLGNETVSYTHLNEIVVPIIIMAYMCSNSIMEFESLLELKTLLVDHGWTWLTAICTMLFCLMHWPCSTTFFTIKKESKSWKWTIISFLTPTLIGMACCFVVANISRIFVPGI